MPANLSDTEKKKEKNKSSENKKPQLFIEHFIYVRGGGGWKRGSIKSQYFKMGDDVFYRGSVTAKFIAKVRNPGLHAVFSLP